MSPPRRIDRRDAGVFSAPAVARALVGSHADVAGEEALLRALAAERLVAWDAVRFWLAVYARIARLRQGPG